mmetsp:Transcript_17412/g.43390  ORF Transcript_17412/g.43390 Transcript_17412/m.43390 type:complete len:86 (-) Transcript_17412:1551-1808(-)
MMTTVVSCLLPHADRVPYNNRSQFNLQVVFYLAVAAHVVEGALCYKKAVKMGSSTPVGWGLQTALLGFPSFRVLLKMEKDGGKTS